ncbi:KRRI-Interacting protein 1 [Trapelia coarctata]|nr:KRRI-Interacting protein 1 [Trapelia coarctata]
MPLRSKAAEEQASASAEGPRKRVKLLLDDDSPSDSDSSDASGGVALNGHSSFKVNEEYARRFEHNQKRAELHRLEEKYGKDSNGKGWNGAGEDEDDSDSDSTSEEEDDDGILALGELDDQVNATLEAIRRKDPRVYDEKVTFYSKVEDEGEDEDGAATAKSEEKPMYLHDYHRENLLKGGIAEEEEVAPPSTYAQQQDELKNSIVKEMHAAADASSDSDEDDEDGTGFLVKKPSASNGVNKSKSKRQLAPVDVEMADKDPENFLSNFMAAKAWVPTTHAKFQPFESDDDEEDRRAEEFEAAYNLRFEDPQASNEKLLSHARDTAAKYSVRKEDTNSRKRAREAEQAKKEAEKQERDHEKARLRKLKIEEAEGKVKRIKEAAGLRGKAVEVDEWTGFLTEDWDDELWEAEMKKRFGENYSADQEADDSDVESPKKKLKKPKWEDDIDITDLVPEFREEEVEVGFSLSDDSENGVVDSDGAAPSSKKRKTSKQDKEEQKRESRRERRKIEALVDQNLHVDLALSRPSDSNPKGAPSRFRYRETSPLAYGLTAHDILMASDSQLNQFAGLKKMAAFRDSEKKKRDRKHLGKKARLRKWRKETFGSEKGPVKSLQEALAEEMGDPLATRGVVTAGDGEENKGKKRKRSKKSKTAIATN